MPFGRPSRILVQLCLMLFIVGLRIEELEKRKIQLQKESEESLQRLKDMNELEKRAINVNHYPPSEELQQYVFFDGYYKLPLSFFANE